MKNKLLLLVTINLLSSTLIFGLKPIGTPESKTNEILFTENKGQVSDQFYKSRKDVLFSGHSNGMVFHLRNNGVSYQLYRINKWGEVEDPKFKHKSKTALETDIYRLDINWLNCNTNSLTHGETAIPGVNNYYLASCPDGALNVKSYAGVFYKNIYKNIDLHYYEKKGALKYDYIVAPGADYKQIKLQIKGAEQITASKNGGIVITTPFGKIEEGAPIVFQNNVQLKANWKIDNNVLSFEIKNYNPHLELIIDPAVRVWGTYYGGTANSGQDEGYACAADASSNSYLTGTSPTATGTNIATFGSHQFTYGGGVYDAYLVKFNAAGVRQWATYYGGTGDETGYSCAVDGVGNVFMAGNTGTSSVNAISTAAGHQTLYAGGNSDAFLVKFNSAGVRQWGTYYGDIQSDQGFSCSTDLSNNIYLAGRAGSTGTVLATSNGFQPSGNGSYLVKFDALGNRIWGTYYEADINGCCTDPSGNVFITGYAYASSSVATSGAHQVAFSGMAPIVGGPDAFLAKFNSAGVRQWGTYYGSYNNDDLGFACAADLNGNVYMVGSTESPYTWSLTIATPSTEMSFYSGTVAIGFIAKFDGTGVRQWGSYVSGYKVLACAVDVGDNVFLCTSSGSSSSPATFSKYNGLNGRRKWIDLYGNSQSYTNPNGIALDGIGNIYLAGSTSASGFNAIATSNAHQLSLQGSQDAFLAKFEMCSSIPYFIVPNPPLCPAVSHTLFGQTIHADSFTWQPGGVTNMSIAISPTVTTTYSLIGSIVGCSNTNQSSNTVSVYPNPTIVVPNSGVCVGNTFTVVPTGAQSYTVFGGPVYGTGTSVQITPTATATYSAIGTSSNGCVSTMTTAFTLSVITNPTINASAVLPVSCSGSSNTLTVNGANTYTWMPGNLQGSLVTVTPFSTTNYTVNGKDIYGCSSASAVVVNASVTPTPIITVNSGNICSGDSFTLNASGSTTTYTWSTNQNGSSIVVTPGNTTSYTVSSTGTNNCTGRAVAQVVIYASPNIIVNSGAICVGKNFGISPQGAYSYTITPSVGSPSVTLNAINISPLTNLTYTVNAKSIQGCNSSNVAVGVVTVNPLPTVIGAPASSTVCAGEQATLTAQGASTYTWSGFPPVYTATYTLEPTLNQSFTVTGKDANGCINTTEISISVDLCTGINENSNNKSFSIYPNPNNGYLTINSPTKTEITIVNALGQQILKQTIQIGENKVDLFEQAKGVYFIILSADSEKHPIKVVKY